MVEPQLSAEQIAIRDTVRGIVDEHIRPRAAEFDARGEFPHEVWQLLADNGVLRAAAPPEYGGLDGKLLTSCVIYRELARVHPSSGMVFGSQCLSTEPIALFGTEDQKERFLPGLAAGQLRAAFALTEPEAGSDLRRVTTEAVPDGDGWRISGRKVFITHADVANVMTVFAKVPGTKKGSLSAFILEREESPWSVERIEKKLGLRASTTCSLVIEDAWVPDANRLGELGDGMRIALSCLNKGRVTTSWQALGIAEAALEVTQDYAERHLEGGRPLAESQSMQFALAEMATDIEATRALVFKAASSYDSGAEGIIALTAMAKLFATDMVIRVTSKAVELLGERGCTAEYPVERMMRDARVLPIVEGTNEIQKLVISRDLRQRRA